jgi:serine/threonine-protein kinase
MYNIRYDKIQGQWTKKSYTIIKSLGEGGVGEIYLVRDSEGRILALKLSTDIISITKEYNFLVKFSHKSFVPKVYDLDDYIINGKHYHYFTMEYIRGDNLKKTLKKSSIELRTKLRLMCIIIQILRQFNEEGYVYTDLKHENIMIDREKGQIKLIDLGSLVQIGSSVKEYTPMYDRLSWGKGKRIADKSYQIFAIAILFISLIQNRSLDPTRDKLDLILSNVKKKLPNKLYNVISCCIEGQLCDYDTLYKEISCSAEEHRGPDNVKRSLNFIIGALSFALILLFTYMLRLG